MQPEIEAQGQWRGRGVCILVDALMIFASAVDDDKRPRAVTGVVLHDLLIWLDLVRYARIDGGPRRMLSKGRGESCDGDPCQDPSAILESTRPIFSNQPRRIHPVVLPLYGGALATAAAAFLDRSFCTSAATIPAGILT